MTTVYSTDLINIEPSGEFLCVYNKVSDDKNCVHGERSFYRLTLYRKHTKIIEIGVKSRGTNLCL